MYVCMSLDEPLHNSAFTSFYNTLILNCMHSPCGVHRIRLFHYVGWDKYLCRGTYVFTGYFNQEHAGQRPACAKIAFVQEVGMCACVCMFLPLQAINN